LQAILDCGDEETCAAGHEEGLGSRADGILRVMLFSRMGCRVVRGVPGHVCVGEEEWEDGGPRGEVKAVMRKSAARRISSQDPVKPYPHAF